MKTMPFITSVDEGLDSADIRLKQMTDTTVVGCQWIFIVGMLRLRMFVFTMGNVEADIFLMMVMRHYGKSKHEYTCQ